MRHPAATLDPGPAATPARTAGTGGAMPTADEAVAHTLLNCLLREVSGPEQQAAVVDGWLLLRLPRSGQHLKVAVRRTSLLGSHRLSGPALVRATAGRYEELGWERLAELVESELSLRSGAANEEFLGQVRSSHQGVALGLASPGSTAPTAYLRSEQSLVLGHRFHPTPKARGGDVRAWSRHAPELGASYRLRHLAVREDRVVEGLAEPGGTAPIDRLRPEGVPDGYRFLPAHPWQWQLLAGRHELRAALDRGDLVDLGDGGQEVWPTASVRTVLAGTGFLKFSLAVRITNCVRKNAAYELDGAVALTRRLTPVADELATRFPGTVVLREPGYRSLDLPEGLDALEGLGVIVREGLDRVAPGSTPLLAAALADEYPTGPAHVSHLLAGAGPDTVLAWWARYLDLVVPPVLAAYGDHGVVFEPHLQNVVVCVADDGWPTQVLLRDLEGTKLLPDHAANRAFLAELPRDVAEPMVYDARRGWDRVVYCLLVNHVAEVLAALADLHPPTEPALWREVRRVIGRHAVTHGSTPQLRGLLAGVPLPAKANLLTRWERRPDRESGYVRLRSPLSMVGPVQPGPATGADGGCLP